MDNLNKLNMFEVGALIKLINSQVMLNDMVDRVYLPALADKLRKELTQRKAGSAIMDMGTGDFSFKFRYRGNNRVAAIKITRTAMGLGLKEAKDLCDTGYDDTLPWAEVTFLNSTETVYNAFQTAIRHEQSTNRGWNEIEDPVTVTPISATPPVGSA